jgi:hypothetical protein
MSDDPQTAEGRRDALSLKLLETPPSRAASACANLSKKPAKPTARKAK